VGASDRRRGPLSEVYGIQQELQAARRCALASELPAAGGALASELPAAWLEDLAVAGDPDECAAKIRALLEAGSDSVGQWLFPRGGELARYAAREVFPCI
jgi:5,10-methylenetetrahydromethanopterin reductase